MKWNHAFMLVFVVLTACGRQDFDDPNVKDQYWIYLEDEQTGQIVSDQVLPAPNYVKPTMYINFTIQEL